MQKSFSSHSAFSFPLNTVAIDNGKLKSEHWSSVGRIKGQWERGACHNCAAFIKWKKVVSSLSLLAREKKKKIPMSISPEVGNQELGSAAGEGTGESWKNKSFFLQQ